MNTNIESVSTDLNQEVPPCQSNSLKFRMSSKKTNTPSVKSKNERNRAVPFSARLFAKTDKPRNRPRADKSLPFSSMYSVSVDLPPVGIGIARGDRFC